jgi:hypothetical protein
MRHAWVFLTILGSGTGALGQDLPGAGEILIESTGPNAHHERRSVPLPPEGPGRDAFLREFVVVDVQSNSTRIGDRALSASEFYTRVERTDLAAQAEDQSRQRVWLMAGGGLVAAAGVAAGLVVMGNAKNTNDPSEMVTAPNETVRLAADYNLALARKHGATGARLQLIPSLAPGQAGLLARLTF